MLTEISLEWEANFSEHTHISTIKQILIHNEINLFKVNGIQLLSVGGSNQGKDGLDHPLENHKKFGCPKKC